MILFIKHIDIEGPETLKEFFEGQGLQTQTIELQNGDSLPEDIGNIEAIISLGGPINVYEEEKYPFLKDEHVFLKNVVTQEIPFLGICLGSQLLAKACEAKVNQSPEKEIGLFPVRFTDDGKKDPLFKGLEETIDVFQWHDDMSDLPSGAELLASSGGCPQQAFRIGSVAYGLQFHIEVIESTIRKWTETYFGEEDPFRAQQKRIMIEKYQQKEGLFRANADTIYNNFLKIIQDRKSKKTRA
ncbi:MAG: type 1 glutamine amidotransferase [Candidatus Omnitrophica bacterium]|nr:type 1 glutamine amidotransferase [Candidatus Omnitrophota bacterium]